VLVNFWAPWCNLCWREVPALNALDAREDVVVIGVAMDYGKDQAAVRQAIGSHELRYEAQVLGGNRRDALAAYRQVEPVDFYPTSYLYSPEGEIVMFIPGQLKERTVLAFMDGYRMLVDTRPARAESVAYARVLP
jgi:thiol-disulfide isomerase/thioredoxin